MGRVIKEGVPYATRNLRVIIESSIASAVGLVTFLIGFLKAHFSMHRVENLQQLEL